MKNDLKHRLYLGIRGFMIRIPPFLSSKGAKKGQEGAKANAGRLSNEERRVHHFIVEKMAVAQSPITAGFISDELGIAENRVQEIIDKLESLKTFIYRSESDGINWAYPFSLENTGFKMTASSGEQFNAA